MLKLDAQGRSLTSPDISSRADGPAFSIFIPVWNGPEWLPGAIQSVLEQTYPRWELIIGDNASTADLEAVVARFPDPRIRHHRWDEHTDLYENFNRTVTLCNYEWLQPLCADDRLQPDCLRAMAERIIETRSVAPRLAAVMTSSRRVDSSGRPADVRYYGLQGRRVVPDGLYDPHEWLSLATQPGLPPWNTGSIAISRTVLAEMGSFFRPEDGLCADQELILRLGAYGNVAYIAEELFDYTVSDGSDSNFRSAKDLSSGDPVPSMAGAMLSALRSHEHRRSVSGAERAQVRRAVAYWYVRRAGQHRYQTGGRGRVGAFQDLVGAVKHHPRMLLSPSQMALAAALLIAPSGLLRASRQALGAGLLTRVLHRNSAATPQPTSKHELTNPQAQERKASSQGSRTIKTEV